MLRGGFVQLDGERQGRIEQDLQNIHGGVYLVPAAFLPAARSAHELVEHLDADHAPGRQQRLRPRAEGLASELNA